MKQVQEIVNILDGEGAARFWRRLLMVLTVVCFVGFYDVREYHNFSAPEAMDAAQLARNIADGKGYVTDNIRITAAMMVAERNGGDYCLKGNQPDIVNPPLYPMLLAGVMRYVLLDWVKTGDSSRNVDEFTIAILNQLLLILAAILTYRLGRRLFDPGVGLFAAIVFFFNYQVWQFSVSGLPNMLSMVILLFLFRSLLLFNEGNMPDGAEADIIPTDLPGVWWTLWRGGCIGFILGAAMLNQYALGWLFLPVFFFMAFTARPGRKFIAILAVVVVFAAVVAPWIVRNCMVSGMPFGLATYAPFADTVALPGDMYERVLTANVFALHGPEFWDLQYKVTTTLAEVFSKSIPTLGGNWITFCFIAGILLPFMRRGLNSARAFVIFGILMLAIAQACTKTMLSANSNAITSENLIVLFIPLVTIFGSAYIYTVIEQINYGLPLIRKMIIGAAGVVLCLPMILALMPPEQPTMAYPPYYPKGVVQVSELFDRNDVIASDMPHAVAWYGRRQCFNLPLDSEKEFYQISDLVYPINGVYLTQLTIDRKFISEFGTTGTSWGNFATKLLTRGEIKSGFPLRSIMGDMLPEQILVTDWERWRVAPRE